MGGLCGGGGSQVGGLGRGTLCWRKQVGDPIYGRM